MIQRIQTLFLLVAAGLLGSLLFSKFCYTPDTVVKYTQSLYLLIFIVTTLFLTVFAIVKFKDRMMQLRISVINILLLIGFQIWIAVIFFKEAHGVAFSVSAVFPVVCAILVAMAVKYIARDEALVRSAYSLRKAKKNRKGIFKKQK